MGSTDAQREEHMAIPFTSGVRAGVRTMVFQSRASTTLPRGWLREGPDITFMAELMLMVEQMHSGLLLCVLVMYSPIFS